MKTVKADTYGYSRRCLYEFVHFFYSIAKIIYHIRVRYLAHFLHRCAVPRSTFRPFFNFRPYTRTNHRRKFPRSRFFTQSYHIYRVESEEKKTATLSHRPIHVRLGNSCDIILYRRRVPQYSPVYTEWSALIKAILAAVNAGWTTLRWKLIDCELFDEINSRTYSIVIFTFCLPSKFSNRTIPNELSKRRQ